MIMLFLKHICLILIFLPLTICVKTWNYNPISNQIYDLYWLWEKPSNGWAIISSILVSRKEQDFKKILWKLTCTCIYSLSGCFFCRWIRSGSETYRRRQPLCWDSGGGNSETSRESVWQILGNEGSWCDLQAAGMWICTQNILSKLFQN